MKKQEVLQYILGFILFAFILGLIQGEPIPQDQTYHIFADRCTHFNIPHFWNVISNAPFLLCGFLFLKTPKTKNIFLKNIAFIMGVGFIATGVGSAYYHWNPNNSTLVWDRIPMTIVFVSFFTMLIHQNVSKTIGKYSLLPNLLIGVFSVIYWIYTENSGTGDLRCYIVVQFYPLISTVIILLFSWKSVAGRWWILLAFFCYVLAKICETQLDHALFETLHISGHTVKHYCSAFAGLSLYYWFKSSIRN